MTDRTLSGMGMPQSMEEAMTSMPAHSEVEQQFHLVEHGVQIAVLGVGLVLAILAVFFLIRFFLKPVTASRLRRSLEEVARSLSGPAVVAPKGNAEVPGRIEEQDTFLVIPDISGYTNFIKLNQFSAAHAQYVVSQLLDAILEASRPVLRPTRIEGDSILFFAVSAENDPRGGVSGEQVGLAVLDLLNAFYSRRSALKHDNACPCEACRHIDDLHLKVVIHRGPLVHYRIKDFDDLSGLAIIAARRLLKNSLGLNQYVLVTEAAAEKVSLPLTVVRERHVDRYDDVGEMVSCVYDLTAAAKTAGGAPRHGLIAGRMLDAVQKLGENARSLGRAARSSTESRGA